MKIIQTIYTKITFQILKIDKNNVYLKNISNNKIHIQNIKSFYNHFHLCFLILQD